MERHRLMISPNGQITLPRNLRQDLSIGNYISFKLVQGKVVMEPVSFINSFDNMVEKGINNEGHAGGESTAKHTEDKPGFHQPLRNDLELDKDAEGNITVSVWQRKK